MQTLERLALTVSSACNGHCTFCFNREREYEMLALKDSESITLAEYKSIIKQAIPLGLKEIELSGGEVLLDLEKTYSMIKVAKNKDLKIGIFTNGVLLTKEVLQKLKKENIDWIRIGFCGDFKTHSIERRTTREEYKKIASSIKNSILAGIKTRLFVTVTKNTCSKIKKTCDFITKTFPGLEHAVIDAYIPNGVPKKDKLFEMTPQQHLKLIEEVLKKINEHRNRVKLIPFYGLYAFLGKKYNGEEVMHSQCGKTRLAILPGMRVAPCLCTLDLVGDLKKEDLANIVKRVTHVGEYNFSQYEPCVHCKQYDLCHDSWCPTLTVNGRGNYTGPPSTCPVVRIYGELKLEGSTSESAAKKALAHNYLKR